MNFEAEDTPNYCLCRLSKEVAALVVSSPFADEFCKFDFSFLLLVIADRRRIVSMSYAAATWFLVLEELSSKRCVCALVNLLAIFLSCRFLPLVATCEAISSVLLPLPSFILTRSPMNWLMSYWSLFLMLRRRSSY
jgi:hypothetical protein